MGSQRRGRQGRGPRGEESRQRPHGQLLVQVLAGQTFPVYPSRRFIDLKAGKYTLGVWVAGGGGEKSFKLFARGYGGPELSADIVDTGWQKWRLYEIKGIPVSGGACEIGLSIEGNAGNWGNADDFEFLREAD